MKPDVNVLSELRMRGEELPNGTSSSGTVCPFCRGGNSKERSFSIARMETGQLLYKCHRASCGAHGAVAGTFGSHPPAESLSSGERTKPKRFYTNRTQILGHDWLSELWTKYGIPKSEADRQGWVEEVDSGRLVVHIRDSSGKERGVHTRKITTRSSTYPGEPKTRDYRESNSCWMGWFWPVDRGGRTGGNPIILVEDVLSATKGCMAGYLCASLMGCSLSLDKLEELFSVGKGRHWVIALDRDATEKALGFVSKYQFLTGGNLIPLLLSKDMKYHTEEEIKNMVSAIVPTS